MDAAASARGTSPDLSQSPTMAGGRHTIRRHPRDRRVHEPGAGPRQAGGQARRYLGVRMRALRNADGPSRISGRDAVRHDRRDPRSFTGLVRAAGGTPPTVSTAAAPVSREGRAQAVTRYRRCAVRSGRHADGRGRCAGRGAAAGSQRGVPAAHRRRRTEGGARVSPDGKMVAFVAIVAGRRQIWIRLLAGGALLQLTRDEADHMHPRWAPDSSTLIYFTPAATDESRMARSGRSARSVDGRGGSSARASPATSATTVSASHCCSRRIRQLALVVAARDGSRAERVALLPAGFYTFLRWAPDDRSIAFQRSSHVPASMATSRCAAWRPANGARW